MILVCGEALIDLFAQSEPADTFKAVVGGSPLNLATGLARLGVPVTFFGGVSTDRFGRLLAHSMSREGVDISMLKRSLRATPLVLITPDPNGHPSYIFYAHETADRDVTLADIPTGLPDAIVAMALGSYSLAAEPIGSALLALAERESNRLVISLDFNLRQPMVGPIPAWRHRMERFSRCAAIIKLSEEDFAGGWGAAATLEDEVSHWLGQGALLVVLTRGASGATAWHRSGRTAIPGNRVAVVDTVAAGDSFHAALLARLAQKSLLSRRGLEMLDSASIDDALYYATVSAGLTCGRRGADLPHRAEVEAAMQRSPRSKLE